MYQKMGDREERLTNEQKSLLLGSTKVNRGEETNKGYESFPDPLKGGSTCKDVQQDSTPVDLSKNSIDYIGSISLTLNNVIGPGMMSLPKLFHDAGVLPSVLCIILCCAGSSWVATFLADAISSIPGNSHFDKSIDFAASFRIIMGENAYFAAEVLFLTSCLVQACAGLVEAAQGVDGFLASFVFEKVSAVQIWPSLDIVSWSTQNCGNEESGEPLDCTPFGENGGLIITSGYFLCAAVFYAFSRGNLKEVIWLQIIVVTLFFLLLIQFLCEFQSRGLVISVPWVGSDVTRLAGVVLFNFAFPITVPSWLQEKRRDVDVNSVVWPATTVSSMIYIIFGYMAAASFANVDTEILKDLAGPQTFWLTRLCAATFGVTIIGCGVPIFCVMMKSALKSSGMY